MYKNFARSAIAILVCALCACATHSASHPQPTTPPAANAVEAPDAQPATQRHEPERVKESMGPAAATGILKAAQALAYALRNNPTLVAKRREVGIAEGQIQQAALISQFNPELSVTVARRDTPAAASRDSTLVLDRSAAAEVMPFTPGSFTVSGNRSASLEQSLSEENGDETTDWSVELSQEIEIFGQRQARRDVADASMKATLQEIAAAEREVMGDVLEYFYAAQLAQHRVALAKLQAEFAQSILDLAERRLNAGDIAKTEYRQTAIQSAQVQNDTDLAVAELQTTLRSLRTVMGLDSDAEVVIGDGLPGVTPPPSHQSGHLAAAIESHPALQRAQTEVTLRTREATLARKEAKPNITGSLFIEREEEDVDIFGFGISAPLPIFNRGQGDISSAEARILVAEAALAAQKRDLTAELRNAVERCHAAYERAERYENEITPLIDANRDQLENAFRLGDISMVEMRVNQRELLLAQEAALNAYGDYLRWRAALESLIGHNLEEFDQ